MASNKLIYGLIDPRDQQLKYVGQSRIGLQRATQLHSARCGYWQKCLRSNGLIEEVIILEEWDGTGLWKSWLDDTERFYIAYFKMIGANLKNLTPGGDGLPAGWKMSEETRKKMSEGHKGKKQSPEHLANRSAALKGRTSVWKGKTLSPEMKAKMSEAAKRRWAEKRVSKK